jgi:glycosyltransferase involved in cell wall biosynthesis
MHRPFFTIAIPLYNCEKYIAATIQSVLNQTEKDFELLIIDGASTDQSATIAKQFNDERIRLIQKTKPANIVENWNSCLQNTRGEWIGLLGADDIIKPDFLETIRAILTNDKAINIIATEVDLIDSSGNITGHWTHGLSGTYTVKNVYAHHLGQNCINISAFIVNKAACLDHVFSPEYIVLLDWEYIARLLPLLGTIHFVPRRLGQYRMHESSNTSKTRNGYTWFSDETRLKVQGWRTARKHGYCKSRTAAYEIIKLKLKVVRKIGLKLKDFEFSFARQCCRLIWF